MAFISGVAGLAVWTAWRDRGVQIIRVPAAYTLDHSCGDDRAEVIRLPGGIVLTPASPRYIETLVAAYGGMVADPKANVPCVGDWFDRNAPGCRSQAGPIVGSQDAGAGAGKIGDTTYYKGFQYRSNGKLWIRQPAPNAQPQPGTPAGYVRIADGPNGHVIGQKADGGWYDLKTGAKVQ